MVRALDGVSLEIEKGSFTAVVGTSGSGKSTLLHMIGGLDTPTSGSVMVGGKELSRISDEELTIFRRRQIGFVFQNYNLVPILNVYENIVLPSSCPGDSSREWPSPGLWRPNRRSCWRMNPPVIWTAVPVRMC